MGTDGGLPVRPLRRDARANRERLLAAAREAFAEAGLGVGVDGIAARAAVGVGTLYRHFPSKEALVDAVFEQRLEELALLVEEALAVADPWAGFAELVERLVELQHADRGFKDVMTSHLSDEGQAAAFRARFAPNLERLIARAQAAGELRPDVVYEDVSVLLWAAGEVVVATRESAPGFWQRYVGLMLDALRVEGATPLRQPPLTSDQHRRSVARWARARRG